MGAEIIWKVGNYYRRGVIIAETPVRYTVARFDPHEGDITEQVSKDMEYELVREESPVRVTFTHGGVRPGAGRHHAPDPVVQCPWGIPKSEMDKFKKVAERKGAKPADLLRALITNFLDEQHKIHSC